jgi:hypothetical protein
MQSSLEIMSPQIHKLIQDLIANQILGNMNAFLNDKLRYVNTLSMISAIQFSPNLVTDKYLSLL